MAKREMVEAHVDNLLKKITGSAQMSRDSDGDWPFALDRAIMYVRVSGDSDPTVRVWGVAAHSVPETEKLFRLLNDLNNTVEFSRALWNNGDVVIATELVGESLDIEELGTALQRVASGADVFGPQVVEACGGETPRTPTPAEPAIADSKATGMYL